ncbi:MAG: serine hydrolase [Candidatus Eremiobacteraeota bacterium]|nr:serine hydrolase [Candidatus Eremiobacteraeota bacterium]
MRVNRAVFLSSAGALCASIRFPAKAETLDLSAVINELPGTAGVFARTMAPGAPLVAYNADVVFPAASVIKLLIMLTAYRAQDRTANALNAPVTIRRSDLVGGSPFLAGARGGERYTVMQLLVPMIRLSDNSAANALISHFGFDVINASAAFAGLQHTHLRRHFLDYSAIVHHHENVTTPRDIGSLLYQIERGSHEGMDTVASSASCRKMIDIMLGQTDRDKIPSGIPVGVPIANKTGEVDGVRNDAAIVNPYGDAPFVLCVLTKYVTNYASALHAISAIANAVYWRVKNSADESGP